MKKFIGVLLLLPLLVACTDNDANPTEIRLISYNIRHSAANDGDFSWEHRKDATREMLMRENPDLFGLQEALADQLHYIDGQAPAYTRVGVGRDDGKEGGETMAVYYRSDRFDCLANGTFWLSETPDSVSRGWDAACNRTVTWVKLREKLSGKEFFYFTTHLDHMGTVAREEGIKLLVAKMEEIAGKRSAIVAGGDFNTTTDDPIFEPLTGWMQSARNTAPETDRKGTFNGYGSTPNNIVIDHLYYRGKIRCDAFRTLTDNYGAPYISDHYPIAMRFTL